MSDKIDLPVDDSEFWKRIPLEGHLCAMRMGKEKHYWRVETLIRLSAGLPVFKISVDSLIQELGNSTWFASGDTATIQKLLPHFRRAIQADLTYPVILAVDGRIMDGTHRLVGAKIKGVSELPAVQFKNQPDAEYVEILGGSGYNN
jgi:hypothetical protein